MRVLDSNGQARDVPLYRRSYALVIGNSKYAAWNDLPGVSQDVAAIADALKRQGFEVVRFNERGAPVFDQPALNLSREEFNRQVGQFIDEYGQDEDNRLLVYYAGHGYTALLPDGRKMGYLVMRDAPEMPPVEDPLARPLSGRQLSAFNRASVNMDQIEAFAKSIASRHVLFVFDSCFAGTVLFRGAEAKVPPYISREDTRPVREFLTSGNELQTVPDNGRFRRAFVRGIEGAADAADSDHPSDGYVSGSELYAYVKKEVAGGGPTPVFGKLTTPELARGDFIFITGAGAATPTPVASSTQTRTRTSIPQNTRGGESVFWDAIQNSTEPADFDKFLGVYPEGVYAAVAKFKRERLRAAAEMARYRSPKQGMTLTRQIAPGVEMEFVGIPAGEFVMGPEDKVIVNGLGRHQQRVKLKDGFWMGRFEVTEKQWRAVTRLKGKNAVCDECPVSDVGWLEAKQFLHKLNELNDGFEYRLPSEAEWEYAARANTKTNFYWGDSTALICSFANVRDKSGVESGNVIVVGGSPFNCNDGYSGVAPVGKFQPNGFGLYDMIGNVSEWCEDAYTYDLKDLPDDGSPNISKGDPNEHPLRGGSYAFVADTYGPTSVANRTMGVFTFIWGVRVVAVAKAQ